MCCSSGTFVLIGIACLAALVGIFFFIKEVCRCNDKSPRGVIHNDLTMTPINNIHEQCKFK